MDLPASGSRKSRRESPPVSNARLQFTGVAYVFIGLMVICWIGSSVWAMLALDMSGRGDGSFVTMVAALIVALVFGALYVALKACGVKFTNELK
jgi:hypothetical protein